MRRLLSLVMVLASMPPLAGCLNVDTPAASPQVTQAAINRERPTPDRARVMVAMGSMPMMISGAGPPVAVNIPGDIYVNEVRIGAVNPDEVMVFDVAPGRYSIAWTAANRKIGWGETQVPGTFDLRGGSITAISANLFVYSYLVGEGLRASLYSADGRTLAPGVKVVRPAVCPPTLCL